MPSDGARIPARRSYTGIHTRQTKKGVTPDGTILTDGLLTIPVHGGEEIGSPLFNKTSGN
jgi:hypothetical protein